MAAYTLDDLLAICLRRAGKKAAVVANPTDEANFFIRHMRLGHSWLMGLHTWDWLRTEGDVALLADVTGQTVSVTAGKTSFDFSGTGYSATGWVGASMKITNTGTTAAGVDVMRVAAMNPAGVGTFTAEFTGETDTDATAVLAQDTYALPTNFDRPLTTGSFIASSNLTMQFLDPERFFRARTAAALSSPIFVGQPESCTIWGNGDGAQNLIVWPYPTDAQVLTIKYWRKPTDLADGGSIPDIPEKWQSILADYALSLWFRDKDLDMTKRALFKASWQATYKQMLGTVERTSDRMSMAPFSYRES